MTPPAELFQHSRNENSTRVYCATCGHSAFVHTDNGNRRCLYSMCDCKSFVVGAEPDISAQVFPA